MSQDRSTSHLIAEPPIHGPGTCPCFPACVDKAQGWRGDHDHAKRQRNGEWLRWECAPDLYFCGSPDCAGSWTPHELAELVADNGGRL